MLRQDAGAVVIPYTTPPYGNRAQMRAFLANEAVAVKKLGNAHDKGLEWQTVRIASWSRYESYRGLVEQTSKYAEAADKWVADAKAWQKSDAEHRRKQSEAPSPGLRRATDAANSTNNIVWEQRAWRNVSLRRFCYSALIAGALALAAIILPNLVITGAIALLLSGLYVVPVGLKALFRQVVRVDIARRKHAKALRIHQQWQQSHELQQKQNQQLANDAEKAHTDAIDKESEKVNAHIERCLRNDELGNHGDLIVRVRPGMTPIDSVYADIGDALNANGNGAWFQRVANALRVVNHDGSLGRQINPDELRVIKEEVLLRERSKGILEDLAKTSDPANSAVKLNLSLPRPRSVSVRLDPADADAKLMFEQAVISMGKSPPLTNSLALSGP